MAPDPDEDQKSVRNRHVHAYIHTHACCGGRRGCLCRGLSGGSVIVFVGESFGSCSRFHPSLLFLSPSPLSSSLVLGVICWRRYRREERDRRIVRFVINSSPTRHRDPLQPWRRAPLKGDSWLRMLLTCRARGRANVRGSAAGAGFWAGLCSCGLLGYGASSARACSLSLRVCADANKVGGGCSLARGPREGLG